MNTGKPKAELRRRLFISFASADIAAAQWLADRLALAGYEPWLDLDALRGGEQWSPEITRVMRDESFRVLHLVSRHSLQDSYAAPERQRARDIGRERREPTLVPLLMEPLARSEWPIEIADLVPIPFQDWGDGLARLLMELDAADAPRVAGLRSTEIAVPWRQRIIMQRCEPLFSNAFSVDELPATVHHFRLRRFVDGGQWDALQRCWAFWNPYGTPDLLSFEQPSESLPKGIALAFERTVAWAHVDTIAKQPTANVIPALLRRSFTRHGLSRGLARWRAPAGGRAGRAGSRGTDWLYVPSQLYDNDKLRVQNWAGKLVPIKLVGERTYQGEPFLAHLAVTPYFERFEDEGRGHGDWLVFLRVNVRPAQPDGSPFEGRLVGSRVKKATRSWTNAHLLARLRAIVKILGDNDGAIWLGASEHAPIVMRPFIGEINVALDEAALGSLGAEAASGESEAPGDAL